MSAAGLALAVAATQRAALAILQWEFGGVEALADSAIQKDDEHWEYDGEPA